MAQQEDLTRRQALASEAHDNMLKALLGFTPCEKLTVGDVKYIARHTQTLVFDALDKEGKS